MPQGVVIAVRPSSSMSEEENMNSASFQRLSSFSALDKVKRVYVKVYDSSEIVWFDAPKGKYRKGNKVSFDIDPSNTITLDGAINVDKLSRDKFFLPEKLLAKVALLASLALAFSVFLDRDR